MATQAAFEANFQVALEGAGFEGLTKADVHAILETLGEEIEAALRVKVTKVGKDGKARKVADSVTVRGLGRWSISDRPARLGRNPQTQEVMKIKASKKLNVKALKPVRDRLGVK